MFELQYFNVWYFQPFYSLIIMFHLTAKNNITRNSVL